MAIFLVATLALGVRSGDPPTIVFDEAHYVQWSRELLSGNLLQDPPKNLDPNNAEHPPLGKYLIALGIQLSGTGQLDLTWDQYEKGCTRAATACPEGRVWEGCGHPNDACRAEARGWRLASVLVGASGVAALYLLGLRLFNSVGAGGVCATFLLLDNLWYLQSRMAMLDVFAAAFTLWAFAFLLRPGWRASLLAGLFLGAALASKYNAFFLLPVFAVGQLAKTFSAWPFRRPAPRAPRLFASLATAVELRVLAGLALGLLLPLLGLAAAYAPYLARWYELGGLGRVVRQFFLTQAAALNWDYGGTFDHPSLSPPWQWIPHLRPTFYYWPTYPDPRPPYIYAVGNVALWWMATAALLVLPVLLGIRLVRTRHALRVWFAHLRAFPYRGLGLTPARRWALACLLFWAGFLPWFLLKRATFQFYMTYNVPYFALVLGGLVVAGWSRGGWTRWIAAAGAALVALWFAFWWPVVSGATVAPGYWDLVWGVFPWL